MFFLSYFFAALSFLAAPVLARYLGVVRPLAFSPACLFDLSGAPLGAEFFDRRDNHRRPLFSGLHGQSPEKLLHHGDRLTGGSRRSGRVYHSIAPRASGCEPDALRLPRAVIFLKCADLYRGFLAAVSRLCLLFALSQRETSRRRSRQRVIRTVIFRDLHHDAKLLMISRGIRAFAFSYLGVVFAIYLDR